MDWKQWFESIGKIYDNAKNNESLSFFINPETQYQMFKARMIEEQRPQQFSHVQELMKQGMNEQTARSSVMGSVTTQGETE